uniref:FLZ-type domain-containing protein n=1 Tax=Fagus sylvatica TaxID=28930 RepID=A0A2N9GFN0_FAGSY
MSAKRMRIMRPSTLGDTSMLNQFPVNSMYLIGGASAAAAESNRRIVTENPMGELGSFLERCFFCKKRIAVNAEVFMYGSLRAFCSPECRAEQFAIENPGQIMPVPLTKNNADQGNNPGEIVPMQSLTTRSHAQCGNGNPVKLFGVLL